MYSLSLALRRNVSVYKDLILRDKSSNLITTLIMVHLNRSVAGNIFRRRNKSNDFAKL